MAFNGRRRGKKNTVASDSIDGIFSLQEQHIAKLEDTWIIEGITITPLGTTVTQSSDNVTGIDLSSVSVNDMLILVYGSEGANTITAATLASTKVSIDVEETGSATYPTVAIMSIKADANIAGNASATLAITSTAATDYRAAVSVFKLSEEVTNSTRTYSVSEAGTSASSNIDFAEGVLFTAYFDEDDSAPTLVGVANTIDEDMGSGSSDFFIGYSPELSSGSGTHSVGYSSGAADGTAFAAAVYRSGTWVAPLTVATVDYLVVAGGGGGGCGQASTTACSGGGAGGMLTASAVDLTEGTTYTITVGAGGTGATTSANGSKGGDSSISGSGFTTVTAYGGGTAQWSGSDTDKNGGSGAGSAYNGTAGTGISGQGNNGGTQSGSGSSGAGGGGAGEAGQDRVSSSQAGAGGDGLASSITGSSIYYAGGGGGAGGSSSGTGGAGGAGGGGDGSTSSSNTSQDGTTNTGGGGGGESGSASSTQTDGGNGGSGVVILRTLSTAASTTGSPTVTTDGSYNIYKFTGSGSITF